MRRQIVSLRGPNAVGKTTLMRQIIGECVPLELGVFDGTVVKGHYLTRPELELPILVIGTYDASKYSGCDRIKSKDAITQALGWAVTTRPDHVFFEGFRVSKSWTPYAELRNRLVREHEVDWLWAFLHPPSEQFIFDRSNARREDASRPLNEKELGSVVRVCANSRNKARALWPKDVLTLDPTRTPEALAEQLLSVVAKREVG